VKVDTFRLSGHDYDGDLAERAFAVAADHGFSRLSSDINPWPMRGAGHRYTVNVDVSGVAAWASLHFDSRDDLLAWLAACPPVMRTEAEAVACYRALAAVLHTTPQEATDGGR